jgi:hypothetical protein
VPAKSRDGRHPAEPQTDAERRLELTFGGARNGDNPAPPPLDVHQDQPLAAYHVRAEYLGRRIAEVTNDGAGRLGFRRPTARLPVIRIEDCFITGRFDLRALECKYVLEFERCRFDEPPDLRQAQVAGLEFTGCWLPGLAARNLRSGNDLVLTDCTVDGDSVDLTDAAVEGSLMLGGSRLVNPAGLGLYADRLAISGALIATNLQVSGELRIPGMKVTGNIDLRGATLDNPERGFAINGYGLATGGNLICGTDPVSGRLFRSNGWLYLSGARIDSDLILYGAELTPGATTPAFADDPYFDQVAALIADRITVNGNVELNRGLRSTGTLRMVNARIGGSLRLTDAVVDPSGVDSDSPVPNRRSVHFYGTHVGGDFHGGGVRLVGQARLVDMTVQGSELLSRATLSLAHGDVVEARRFNAGGNFDLRYAQITGSVLLQSAKIGANLDLRGTRLSAPGSYTHDGSTKPSLDIRGVQIGRDLVCAAGVDSRTRIREPFSANGEVRMQRATVNRQTDFDGADLGSNWHGVALDAYGAQLLDLVLTVGGAPQGKVILRHVRCASFADNHAFWQTTGQVDLDDFRYESLTVPIGLKEDAKVIQRMGWLRKAMAREYRPGPYDQFAAVLRSCGNDEHATTVLMEKQKLRYAALAEGVRLAAPGVRLWSLLQRWTVGYGYRPARALGWLLLFLALGSAWFWTHRAIAPVNADDTLLWNPVLYTLDLLVPIVDFGNKARWQLTEQAQWISALLTACGWILATNVAAGIGKMLKRD